MSHNGVPACLRGRRLVQGTALTASLVGLAERAAAAGLHGPAAPWVSIASVSVGALAAAGALALCVSPAVRRAVIPPPVEDGLADILQFDSLLDDGVTLRTKDGRLVQTLLLRGLDYGAKTPDEIKALLMKRQAWFQAISAAGQSVKLLAVRDKVAFDADAEFAEPMLQQIHDRWMASFESVYTNRHYVVVSAKDERKGLKRLNEVVQGIRDALHDYGPEKLSVGEGDHSPLLTFWASMVNGFHRTVPPADDLLGERLVTAELHFDPVNGRITWQDGPLERVGQIVTVQHWGEADGPELLERLLSLPCRVQVLQLLYGERKERSAAMLPMRAKQAALVMFNKFKAAEYEAALDLVNGDLDGLIDVQCSILLQADTWEELDGVIGDARRVLQDVGAVGVIECASAEWTWRGRLPGFADARSYTTRPRQLLGENLAGLTSFGEEASGSERSDWGDGPIRVFRTASGGAYSFQFHVSEASEAVGHTVTFAPTGTGKSVLMSHLMGGALRHANLGVYAFDSQGGLQTFTEAVGGRYIDPTGTLTDSEDVDLNPLQMPDTPSNRRFLQMWLLRLAGITEEDSGSYEAASRAVEAIFAVRRVGERSLRSVFEGAFDTGSPLRDGLKRWVAEGDAAADVFNGPRDSLNLDRSRLVTFEMGQVISGGGKDVRLAGALVSYIMHRIRERCRADAAPHMVFIDETAALLADDAFRRDVEVMLREHRKLRGSVNLAFQDVSVMLNSGIGETVLNNCPTHIIFQNPNARWEDYEVLGLTEGQWAYVKGTSRAARHLSRSFLLKRGQEAVILDCDLTPLGPLLKIYRSGAETARLVRELKAQVGDRWVEVFINMDV